MVGGGGCLFRIEPVKKPGTHRLLDCGCAARHSLASVALVKGGSAATAFRTSIETRKDHLKAGLQNMR